jgi:xylulokinase
LAAGNCYLGIDVGTSAIRVSVVGDDGVVVATASVDYPTRRAPSGVVEQDPAAWTDALLVALSSTGVARARVSAIGLCGQTPTVVLVDGSGDPVAPALTWQDTRAASEARELAERFGDPEPLLGTALPWSPANMPAKLLWLSRHNPEVRSLTRWVLQPKDLVGMWLTGSPLSDPWSSKGLCRVTDGSPATEVFEACEWSPVVCPQVAHAWQARGVVTEAAAERFGLPAGVPVSVGWSDALAQVLAAGCFERSSAFVFSGTSSIVGTPVSDERVRAGGLFSVPKSCAPRALLYGPTQSSGASIEWVSRLLGCSPGEIPSLAATAKESIPLFLPYLSGERAPLWDQDVRALLLGISDSHGRAEVARAVLVGVFLSARHVLDLVRRATAEPIEEVEVVGRGVGDPAWESIGLDVMQLPLRFHEDADMSARGAAMLGAVAAGTDLESVSRELGDDVRRVAPGVAQTDAMLDVYRRAGEVAIAWKDAHASWEESNSWSHQV